MIDVVSVKPLGGFRLRVAFSDGSVGVHDFSSTAARDGEMVRPLKDPAFFARVFVELGALTWPNGFDLDPIALHNRMAGSGELSERTKTEHTLATESVEFPRIANSKGQVMPDDLSNRGPADRSRVNVHEDYEVRYWTQRFGVTADQLRSAVREVGPVVHDVARRLGKQL